MTNTIIQQLKKIPSLQEVPEEQLQWMVSRGECLSFKAGECLFKKGDPIDKMHIILSGSFVMKIQQNGQFRVVGSLEQGMISGTLPYSRASSAIGQGEATSDAEVLALDKKYFNEMIHDHHELTTALVHVMSSRIRQFTKMQQQNDKMMALGKLSAGLAHELNNPSAAAVRSAQTLRKHLKMMPESFKDVISIRMEENAVDAVNHLLFQKVDAGIRQLSLLEKTDCEDEIAEKFENLGFDDGYELAENFVDFGFGPQDFDLILKHVPEKDIKPVISWINQVLTTERLVGEIENASQRISDLVRSVKSYTHMDQAPEKQETDIHKGIDSTLTMLNHKIKTVGAEIVRKYEPGLVKPCLYVSEMNQVWTNLIDNALDALEESQEKRLEIETRRDGDFVRICIVDSGKGIPEEIQGQIFDPFFTTKPVGRGTGLGLDVVHQIVTQHNGSIEVNSRPGRTAFEICLPVK